MDPLVRLLTDGATPRTWSVLVTIMGDMASEPGAGLSGPLLARLTGGMGIRPSALRTALHRLRREGWIESRREGRATTHGLTEAGRAETLAASPRIYGPAPEGALHLVLVAPSEALPAGAVAVAPELALAAGPAGWSVPIDAPPPWVAERVAPIELLAMAADVADRLGALTARLDAGEAGDATVLRLLVLHLWRRLALRVPSLPEAAFGASWRGGEARRLAHALLIRLPVEGGGHVAAAPEADQNGESGK